MIPPRLTWVLRSRESFQSANVNSQLSSLQPYLNYTVNKYLRVSDAKPVIALVYKGGANQTAGLISPEIYGPNHVASSLL